MYERSMLPEFSECNTREEYERVLKNAGFCHIGGGLYAEVYGLPGADWVVKATRGDIAYTKFLHFVRQLPCELFPHIYDHFEIGTENGYFWTVTVLEKLENLRTRQDANTLANVAHYTASMSMSKGEYFWWGDKPDTSVLSGDFQAACELLGEYAAEVNQTAKRGINLDLHSGNIMLRGEQMVITDPFS